MEHDFWHKMIVKHFGCTAIHNKALFKCLIHKIKNYNFDPYQVLLATATNIPMLLIQGHISAAYSQFPLIKQLIRIISRLII